MLCDIRVVQYAFLVTCMLECQDWVFSKNSSTCQRCLQICALVSAGRVKFVGQELPPPAGFGVTVADPAQLVRTRRNGLERGQDRQHPPLLPVGLCSWVICSSFRCSREFAKHFARSLKPFASQVCFWTVRRTCSMTLLRNLHWPEVGFLLQ